MTEKRLIPRSMQNEEQFHAELRDAQAAFHLICQSVADLTRQVEHYRPILVGIEEQYCLMKQMEEIQNLKGEAQ